MQVEIIGQDHKGRGIAKVEGKIIFVEGALPEEVCEVEVKDEKKRFQEAIVVKKLTSKSVASFCPYYPLCGGCDLLHQSYADQLAFKEKKVEELVQKFAGIHPPFQPIIYAQPFAYRNKITLHHLGLYRRHTHEVLPVDQCMIASDAINALFKRLVDYQRETGDVIEDALIRSTNLGEALLSLTGNIQVDKLKRAFSDVSCIAVNGTFLTDKKMVEDKLRDFTFSLSKESFYQVNRFLTEKLYQEVVRVFKEQKYRHVLDLYCGVGTISLFLAPYVEHVTGIEVIPEAIQNAKMNQEKNKVCNVDFICGKVSDYIDQFQDIDAIVVDPPRSGIDQKTISHILQLSPKTLVYVSCDPATFARDLNILKERYDVSMITPVDMFPNTCHVESVCVLNRR